MGRYVSWLANAGLLVLCCLLLADSANAVFDALLTPAPTDPSEGASRPPPAARLWSDREVILTRNLFHSSLLAPPPPRPKKKVVVKKELEPTKLPLSLLGTAASPNAALSWAAVEDRSSRRTVVLRVDDEVKNKAKVTLIERRRIVLLEDGVLRELLLSEKKKKRSTGRSARSSSRRPSRARRSARAPRPAAAAALVPSLPMLSPAENMTAAKLFSDARILPKWVDGELVGMQVNTIQPGGLFEEAGFRQGDVITQLNGIAIDSPEKSMQILSEVAGAAELTIEVDREDGPTTLNVTLPQPE